MSTITALEASMRADIGKGASRRLRKTGLIPGIIYGAKQAPISINLQHHKIIKALEDEAFYSRILTLKLDGKDQQVVLKDLQRHPFKKQILHMDFLRVKSDEAIIRPFNYISSTKPLLPASKSAAVPFYIMKKKLKFLVYRPTYLTLSKSMSAM